MISIRAASTYSLPQSSSCIEPIDRRNDKLEFLVSTNNVNGGNSIHMFEYDEERDNMQHCFAFMHPKEIVGLGTHKDSNKILTCSVNDNLNYVVEMFSTPDLASVDTIDVELISSMKYEYKSVKPDTFDVAVLSQPGKNVFNKHGEYNHISACPVSQTYPPLVRWCPQAASKFAVTHNKGIYVYDVEKASPVHALASINGSEITGLVWMPQRDGQSFMTCQDTSIATYDVRINKVSGLYPGLHSSRITSIDANGNRPFTVITGCADGTATVWDIRTCKQPILTVQAHTNHVTQVCYNDAYDQLVLTAGTDGDIALYNMKAASSTGSSETRTIGTFAQSKAVERTAKCGDLEAPIQGLIWCNDWTFAAISPLGKVIAGHVPTDLKFSLLL